ncbi:MAG: NADPH-dependent 7-cyano-7-deazaguanine reductase QueF [Dehalococcoidia bacterium]|nr:NADPH-dependent 7-cyano-7-deazaguanine reductase QueF [Dehalococcoidia bacterium]
MAERGDLKEQYLSLDREVPFVGEEAIDSLCLLVFPYEYPDQESEVVITTDEFTAVCPWTGLPDYGTLTLRYVPGPSLIELKSLKYYLLSYRQVGIVQEHAANRILKELAEVACPKRMTVTLDYKVRGGLHTTVTVHQSEL